MSSTQKTYKVISLYLTAASGTTYKGGDIVKADFFPEGRAEELVKQDFLIEVHGNTEPGMVTDEDKAKAYSAVMANEGGFASGALVQNATSDAVGEDPLPENITGHAVESTTSGPVMENLPAADTSEMDKLLGETETKKDTTTKRK